MVNYSDVLSSPHKVTQVTQSLLPHHHQVITSSPTQEHLSLFYILVLFSHLFRYFFFLPGSDPVACAPASPFTLQSAYY